MSLIGDFTPTPGQQFIVLTAADVVDNGLALGGPLAGSFNLLVDDSSVILQAIEPGLLGDYNQDGTVDAADYVVWRKHDGTQQGYNTWRANFGATAGSGAAGDLPFPAAVPEPATFLLAALGLAVGLYFSTKGHRFERKSAKI